MLVRRFEVGCRAWIEVGSMFAGTGDTVADRGNMSFHSHNRHALLL